MKISKLSVGSSELNNLSNLNIIMGRNGAGKSRFLRGLERGLHTNGEYYVRYVSPERAGTFKRDGNIITAMSSSPGWLGDTRSVNQASNFKAASAALLREEETLYLRRLQDVPEIRNDPSRTFKSDRLDKINALLTNISMEMGKADIEFKTLSGELVSADHISSGESEAVSLATEILYFFDTIEPSKFNILFLDEPDVHLHPDLQARLGKLIITMLDEFAEHLDSVAVCITTHSAPFVCSVAASSYTSVGTKNFGIDQVTLKTSSSELKKIAPFFGHPLSLTLSEDAPLIIEGEDDERVWQQAARSSQGRIKLFPVLSTTVDQQGELEDFCVSLLETLYDNPLAFSLRDGDGKGDAPLEHKGPLKRYRLKCYAIENLLVTDESLSLLGKSWEEFKSLTSAWIGQNPTHKDVKLLQTLLDSSDRLRHTKIKDIRQLICTIAGSKKPWEVVVGQALASISRDATAVTNMLVEYVGEEPIKQILYRA